MTHTEELNRIIQTEIKPRLAIVSMRIAYLERERELADVALAQLLDVWRRECRPPVN